MLLTGFPPLVGDDPTVLVLGSMPSERSLAEGRYYAQPSNRFWRLMADLVGFPLEAPWDDRVAVLSARGVALWDVLKHCLRVGSLDSAIERATEVPNALVGFLEEHTGIRRVLLNGRTAERAFAEHVIPSLASAVRDRVDVVGLPSTSAANARWGYAALLEVWGDALRDVLR